jgi:hypothetical protein
MFPERGGGLGATSLTNAPMTAARDNPSATGPVTTNDGHPDQSSNWGNAASPTAMAHTSIASR